MNRQPLSAYTFSIIIFIVFMSSYSTLALLVRHSDMTRQSEITISHAHATLNRLSILEWQSIARHSVDKGQLATIQATRNEFLQAINSLFRLNDPLDEKTELIAAWEIYNVWLDKELHFIGAGDTKQAEEIDEKYVDPAFENLNRILSDIEIGLLTDGAKVRRNIIWGSIGLILVTGLFIGLLMSKNRRTVISMERLRAEQEISKRTEETLQQAHDMLEQRVAARTEELASMNEKLQEEISERKLIEAELNRFHRHLEELIQQRTEELEQSNQLLQIEISERKQAAELLRESEERYRTLLEIQRDIICRWLPDTTLTFVNQAYCNFFGKTQEELVGQSWLPLVPETIRESVRLRYEKLCRFPEVLVYEHQVTTGEGEVRWQAWSETPIFDTTGLLKEYQSVGRDITARKEAEEELNKYREHLEAMVKERTAELEEKNVILQELNAALKVLLKKREEDKREIEETFVINIRNLILPYIEMMKKGRRDDNLRSHLDMLEKHLHNIATPLIKNIKQFNLTPTEIKVAALVKQGKSTKEIAGMLGIAASSIDSHRKSIRNKSGLNDRKVSLQAHLISFDN